LSFFAKFRPFASQRVLSVKIRKNERNELIFFCAARPNYMKKQRKAFVCTFITYHGKTRAEKALSRQAVEKIIEYPLGRTSYLAKI
jgi:hypothetical protein